MSRETSSSQQNETGFVQSRMPVMLQIAAIEGNRDELVRLLTLEQPQHMPDHSAVTINYSSPSATLMEHLQSVTHSGETILHILAIKGHNELAAMVFQKDKSLLKAPNKMHETPLHFAAKVGNKEVIAMLGRIAPSEVKDAVRVANCVGETALHEAAKHGNDSVVDELMRLDLEVAYEVNNRGLSPLYIAIVEGCTSTVKTMLVKDARLAKIPDSNGLFPVHVAAEMGNAELVLHFMQAYPDSAQLTDHERRNIFHIAAEKNKQELLAEVFNYLQKANTVVREMVAGMINAKDCNGNTPLHIAAIKGDRSVMKAIWKKMSRNNEPVQNNKGQTAFDLSVIQLKTTGKVTKYNIKDYVDKFGRQFTSYWFNKIMRTYEKKLQRTQVLGLGSVLITTVAFAAAFAVPGGLVQDTGTPVLGRKYFFKAFLIADALAFLQAFASLFNLAFRALTDPDDTHLEFALLMFLSAASCMVVAFGSGLYVMLASVSMPIAILILVATLLFGSPIIFFILIAGETLLERLSLVTSHKRSRAFGAIAAVVSYSMSLLFIFCLAFL